MANFSTISPLVGYSSTKGTIDDVIPGTEGSAAQPSSGATIEEIQVLSLWIMFGIGLPGNLTVIVWIYVNLRRRSRINTIVLGLASADLMVCFFGMLANAMYIPIQHNIFCKIFYFCTGISLISSPNMVVVMALDRHQAIIYPLKKFVSAWKLVFAGWSVAIVLAAPQLFVWSFIQEKDRCATNFKHGTGKLVYILYISIITFLVPLILICFAYSRISHKIWTKAQEHNGKGKKGKVTLKRSGNKSLSKAKVKTLKMTVVIIFFFVVCTLPYFIVEVARIFVDIRKILHAYGICSTLAVSNSAINPYIFLAFNVTKRFWNDVMGIIQRYCPSLPGRLQRGENNNFKSVRFSSSNSKADQSSRGVTIVSRVTNEITAVPEDEVDSL